MNCEQIENQGLVRRFLNDELTGEKRQAFKAHCADCGQCQSSLQLAASLMLQPPLPVSQVSFAEEPTAEPLSMWESLTNWLFPSGVGRWQPALAFAAVLLVAIPVLQRVWLAPADSGSTETTLRGAEHAGGLDLSVDGRMRASLKALNQGEAQVAYDLLGADDLKWDDARMAEVREAYRVRARAAAELGLKSEARVLLNKAKQLTMLDAEAEACLEQDLQALSKGSEFCPLPAL